MDRAAVSAPALRERLGDQALGELAEMMSAAGRAWRDEVLELATERFGRMLAEEAGKIRVEIANLRAELLKWSFAFWIGQVVAMIGVLAFMLRGVR